MYVNLHPKRSFTVNPKKILVLCFFCLALVLIFTSDGLISSRQAEPDIYPAYPDGCTSILVGKKASTDGSSELAFKVMTSGATPVPPANVPIATGPPPKS